VVATIAAYSGYPPNTQRPANEHLSEGHQYCCEHAGGVSRNGACVDPATLSVEGAAVNGAANPTLGRAGNRRPATAVNPG
jgi:hypothetical protein